MGPQFLRVLSSILFAFLALVAVLSTAAEVSAQDGEPIQVSVMEEVFSQPGYYLGTNNCWTLVLTSTVDATPYTFSNVCTDEIAPTTIIGGVPQGEYWVELFDPYGNYTAVLDPHYLDWGASTTGPVYIPTVDSNTLFFIATPVTGSYGTYTPTGTNVAFETPVGSVTFANITQEGETTITATNTAPALPEGYLQVGGVYYDVSTTATFDSATLCFPYDPTTVDGSTLSLMHYENGAWVDVTTTNDTVNGVICGGVTSFSPFAVVSAPVIWSMTGFHAPVDMTPGLVNTVKGGSAVPLKFNVYQDDVEVTDPAAVVVSIVEVACSGGATDPVDGAFETEAGTGLTYSGTAGVDGQFIQVWKTPKVAVTTCYQATASLANGTAITALFQLNP